MTDVEDIARKHNIDPTTVIKAHQEAKCHYMWRSQYAGPFGGTYEAQHPRDIGDKVAATRVSTVTTIEVIGIHPDGETVFSSLLGPRTVVTVADEGEWAFKPAE